jgi:hypothetical protein
MAPPPRKEASEVDLPFGIKFKGMAANSVMPYLGWILALGAGFYFVNGPVMDTLRSLESRVQRVEQKQAESSAKLEEVGRDIRRLYRMDSRIPDARGTEISAYAVPTATAYGVE